MEDSDADDIDAWIEIEADSVESLQSFGKKIGDAGESIRIFTDRERQGIVISSREDRWMPEILEFFAQRREAITFVPVHGERYPASHTLSRPMAGFDHGLYQCIARVVGQLEVRLGFDPDRLPDRKPPVFPGDVPRLISILEAEEARQAIPEAERNLVSVQAWWDNPPLTVNPWDHDVQWEAGLYTGSKEGLSRLIQKGPAHAEAVKVMAELASRGFAPEQVMRALKLCDEGGTGSRPILCYLAEFLRDRVDLAQQILGDNPGKLLRRSLGRLRGLGSPDEAASAAALAATAVDLRALLGEVDMLAIQDAGGIFSAEEEIRVSAIAKMASLYDNTYPCAVKAASSRAAMKVFCLDVWGHLLATGCIDAALHASLVGDPGLT